MHISAEDPSQDSEDKDYQDPLLFAAHRPKPLHLTIDFRGISYLRVSHGDKCQVYPRYHEKDHDKRDAHKHPLEEADLA